MPYDVHPELGHPEAAAWALRALDPDATQAFGAHLRSCDRCQAEVTAFESVARALNNPAPAVEPPDDLEARTMAAVQYASMSATSSRKVPDKATRWWHFHWTSPLVSALAAAAVTAAIFIGVQVFQLAAPAVAATINLRPAPGFSGSGTATARHTSGGWEIQLSVKGLPALRSGQFYECWYAGPDNRPGNPELITAGTFVVGRGGSGTFTMWSAADPAKFNIMQITAEQPGDASQHGKVILTGTARSSHG